MVSSVLVKRSATLLGHTSSIKAVDELDPLKSSSFFALGMCFFYELLLQRYRLKTMLNHVISNKISIAYMNYINVRDQDENMI